MSLLIFLKNSRGSVKCFTCRINTSSKYINCYKNCTEFSKEEKDSNTFYKFVKNKETYYNNY